jgi:dolichyl-phosphate-mannose--protein O-mannosyl transferase
MATDTTAPGAVAASDEPPLDPAEPAGGGRRTAIILPLVLFVLAAVLRFGGLGYPERIYFDETYYAPQGQELITRGVEEGFAVHPPVGKWLIGAGIAVFGYECSDPPAGQFLGGCFGFRAASALAGSLMVLFTYFLGLRLFRRRGAAALAAFLVAIDGLALTMSRISMLDIFLAMFVVLGFWFILIDRDALWRDLPEAARDRRALPPRSRRWRWAAGIAFGLALATKWSGLLAIGGAGLFVVASELLWRRRITGSPWTQWWKAAGSAVLTLIAVPLVVYVLSYAGWFTNFNQTRLGLTQCPEGVCNISTLGIVNEWWGEQMAIARFHENLEAEHLYRSHPITWLYLGRPVAYYYESCSDDKLADGKCVTEQGNVEEVLGVGNPAIWWLGLLAFPAALWFALRHRDWRAGAVLGFYLVQYLPWLFVLRPNFLFYMTPAVPFLCLTLTYVVWRLSANMYLRWLPAVVGVLALAAFAFFYPVWTGAEMPTDTWQLRMWFRTWI